MFYAAKVFEKLSERICTDYHCIFWWQGDNLKVKVKGLTSTKTQLPVSYYSLPFCRPEKIEDDAENLGEILLGDRSENSPYLVAFISFLKIIQSPLVLTCLLCLYCHYQSQKGSIENDSKELIQLLKPVAFSSFWRCVCRPKCWSINYAILYVGLNLTVKELRS